MPPPVHGAQRTEQLARDGNEKAYTSQPDSARRGVSDSVNGRPSCVSRISRRGGSAPRHRTAHASSGSSGIRRFIGGWLLGQMR